MKENNKIRLGVIGLGGVARLMHAEVWSTEEIKELFHITKAYDPSPESIAKFELSHPAIFNDLTLVNDPDQILLDKNIDAIAILSPTSSHFDLIKSSIKADKPIFLEKPITKNLDEAEEILDLLDKKHIPIQVGMVRRYSQTADKLHSLIDKPDIGKLLWMHWDEHRPFASGEWKYSRENEGDSLLLEKATHHFDMFKFLADSPVIAASGVGKQYMLPTPEDNPKEVRCSDDKQCLKGEGFDYASVILEHQSGITSSLNASYVSPWGKEQKLIMQFESAKVVVFWDWEEKSEKNSTYIYLMQDDKNRTMPWGYYQPYPPSNDCLYYKEVLSEPRHSGSISQWIDFYEVVKNNKNPKCSFRDGVYAISVSEAVYKAIVSRQTINM